MPGQNSVGDKKRRIDALDLPLAETSNAAWTAWIASSTWSMSIKQVTVAIETALSTAGQFHACLPRRLLEGTSRLSDHSLVHDVHQDESGAVGDGYIDRHSASDCRDR
jgi:hypothetical protein